MEIKDYTDAELRLIPEIVIEEGCQDAEGKTRDRWLRNPFAGVDADLARRWSSLVWHRESTPEPATLIDPMDFLAEQLDLIDGAAQRPWFAPPECDGSAIHPIVDRDAEGWEARCGEMHERQTIILPPEKPGGAPVVKPVVESGEPVNFEDLPEDERLALSRVD